MNARESKRRGGREKEETRRNIRKRKMRISRKRKIRKHVTN